MIYLGFESNHVIKKKIKQISVEKDIPIARICEKLGILSQSYQNLFKKKKLAFSDIADILNCLDYDLVIEFKEKDSEKLKND